MNDWLRSRARWLGAALIVVLAGGVAYMLRDGGSAHAQAGPRGIVQARAIAPVLASAAGRSAGGARSQSVSSTSGQARATATATAGRRSGPRPGVPTPPPSRRALSQALRQATGLNPAEVTSRRVCGAPAPGHATCAAEALVLRTTGALVRPRPGARPAIGRVRSGRAATAAAAASPPDPATPAYLQQAYDLTALSQTGGSGDTVAIVDPFDDPTAEADLGVYRSAYGLPACTSANGCFRKVNQTGGTASFPPADSVWDSEISLDLDAVSAICPNCHILLVEANSTSVSDLQAAMQTADSMGANQISDSWTAGSQLPLRHTFPGVATVAATGDNGYVSTGAVYPAAYSDVTAAGGTSLASDTSSLRGFGEQAWFGGGSGCNTRFSRPSYQPNIGCSGRVFADLSADADPDTGLKIYTPSGWAIYGGTSLATPVIAAYYAITGVSDINPQWAYTDSGLLNDVLAGSNGSCGTAVCNAQIGFDGPTGVGSISGTVTTGAPGVAGPTYTSGTQTTYTQSVGSQGATIGGGIYRNGLDTTWWIEYGTSQTYGAQTTPVDVGAGTAPVAVIGTLTGLTPGTVYHYRLVAKNARGTTYGYDYTLTTAPASAPSAAFTASPSAPTPSTSVSFDASGSTAGTGGTISDYSWNFGDGNSQDTGTTATASHPYTTRGTYTVTLTITNNHAQTSTSTQTVIVDNPPTAAVAPSTTWTAPGAPVTFDASASSAGSGGTINDYSWDFGDGTGLDSGASDTATHKFPSPGVYTVKLTTTDDLNVASSTTTVITVDQPNASFTATPSTIAPAGTISFDGSGSTDPENDTITDYSWNFGDGHSQDTGTTPTASNQYATRGNYNVKLTITNSHGQTSTSTQTVTVDNPPTAAVTPSTTWTAPGAPVTFDASGSHADTGGTIKDYGWDFGDGTIEHTGLTSAKHPFAAPGAYTVKLTVTDDLGLTSSTTVVITVDQPTASFTAAPPIVAPGGTVSFDGSGSTDPEHDTITDYSWNFGDGNSQDTGTTPTASHPYPTRGNYNVTLTVTNSHGQTSTSTQTVSADTPPTPAFTVTPSSITAGSPVTFDGSASSPGAGGTISDYTWNFGDGTVLDTHGVASAPYTFPTAGPHTVTLTTTDDLGVSAATSQQVIVQAPISATSTPPPPPAPVTTPTPTPPPPPPSKGTSSPSLVLRLSVAGRQRLAAVLTHGLRVRLAVNQRIRTSYQISIPLSETLLGAGQAGNRKATVVLLRGSRNVPTGSHTIFLKLSRAAARRLSAHGPLVLTVRMTLTGANGKTLTRTVKITLMR